MENHIFLVLELSLLRRLCVGIATNWPSEIGPNFLVEELREAELKMDEDVSLFMGIGG